MVRQERQDHALVLETLMLSPPMLTRLLDASSVVPVAGQYERQDGHESSIRVGAIAE